MSLKVSHLASLGFGLLAIASSPFASAQVTLNLTTAQQTGCVVTTDANGLALVPGTTNLQATGVTLTGAGCGTSGSDFQTTLNVPGSGIVAGTPFNVSWSAAAVATQCYYTGSQGLTGWPAGSVACQGAACTSPAQHLTSVTATAAASYTLGIVCTNASGFKESGITASAPPLAPQPADFALTVLPASPVINVPFTVSWSVTGANTCTASATLAGVPVTLNGWNNGITSTTSPRTVTATAAGTYNLSLACANGAGTTTSHAASVTVSSTPIVCNGPAGLTRQLTASITYVPSGSGTYFNADLTNYDNIWGHAAGNDTAVTFPGRSNAQPALAAISRTQYIAAKFHVPANIASTSYGWISRTDYNYGADITTAISTTCGDFSPTAACVSSGQSGANSPKWDISPTVSNKCHLTPDTDYYFNIKFRDPTQSTTDCSPPNACTIGTANTFSH